MPLVCSSFSKNDNFSMIAEGYGIIIITFPSVLKTVLNFTDIFSDMMLKSFSSYSVKIELSKIYKKY